MVCFSPRTLLRNLWNDTIHTLAAFQVIVVENAPRESLGAANGLVQSVASGTETFAPTVASSLFALSLERHLWGGNFVFYILAFVALVGVRLVQCLPKTKPKNLG
jgi:MFS family permease